MTPIALSYYVNPPYFYEQGKVSGFGMALIGDQWLMQASLKTGYFYRIERNKCDFVLGHEIAKTSFCAQDQIYDSSICYGDNGSGFTVHINGINTLVGIVSIYTNMCNPDFPVVFTEVSSYSVWIVQQIDEN